MLQPEEDIPADDLTNLRAETAQLKVKLTELNTAHKAVQAGGCMSRFCGRRLTLTRRDRQPGIRAIHTQPTEPYHILTSRSRQTRSAPNRTQREPHDATQYRRHHVHRQRIC